jgi:hypothetical protein
VLARLSARAPQTVATEAWPPNVPVAGRRLQPLGVPVVQDEGARDNTEQDANGEDGGLPFRDETFDLICNRHEAFRAAEVARLLVQGGTFITQQVDCHSYDELAQALGLEVPTQPESWLPVAERQVTDAGLIVQEAVRGEERIYFEDVAGIVYYLRVVSWSFPGYSLEKHRGRLRALFEDPSAWPVTASQRQFMLVATKPR